MKKKAAGIIILIAAIALGVCSWILLPDTVAVQVGFDGQVSNTMPKLLAVAVPLLIAAVGSVMTMSDKSGKKGLVLALVGVAVMILSLVFNLK